MLGHFQQTILRIEVDASVLEIGQSLLEPAQLQQWLWPQHLSAPLPARLQTGTSFKSWVGPIKILHSVELAEATQIRIKLNQGVDGFHEWLWGEGWVQSRLEGISLLPLSLSQTLGLLRLRQFLHSQ